MIVDPVAEELIVLGDDAMGQDSFRVIGMGAGWVVGTAGDRQLLRVDLRSGLTRVLLDQTTPTIGQTD